MERIPPGDAALAQQILVWILHVKGSLTVAELQQAIAVSPLDFHFEPNRLVSEATIVSVCRGLITVESQTRYVRLIRE